MFYIMQNNFLFKFRLIQYVCKGQISTPAFASGAIR